MSKVNMSAVQSLSSRLAGIAASKMAARKGYEWIASDTPWLDFFKEIFTQLLPVLIGCLGSASASEMRRPGRVARARLRMEIRSQLGDRESVREFADPVFDSIIEATESTTESDVSACIAA